MLIILGQKRNKNEEKVEKETFLKRVMKLFKTFILFV